MTLERWRTFSEHEQLLFIGSELERARVWQTTSEKNFKSALERALELIDLTIEANRRSEWLPAFLGLKREIIERREGTKTGDIEEVYRAL